MAGMAVLGAAGVRMLHLLHAVTRACHRSKLSPRYHAGTLRACFVTGLFLCYALCVLFFKLNTPCFYFLAAAAFLSSRRIRSLSCICFLAWPPVAYVFVLLKHIASSCHYHSGAWHMYTPI